MSHMGVIALALLALAIATVVWLFERMRVDNFSHAPCATQELEAMISLLEDEALESGPLLARDNKAEGNATV